MPTEPDKHDLLGFPNTEAEHHKVYIRRLGLVAEKPNGLYPRFLNENVQEFAGCLYKVGNRYLKDKDKLHEKLHGDAFSRRKLFIYSKTKALGSVYGAKVIWLRRNYVTVPQRNPLGGVSTQTGKPQQPTGGYEKNAS